jgi:hypothetical protein
MGARARRSARRQEAERTRSKDDLARDELVPLEEGERPRAVTVAAIVAGLLALSNVIGYAAGLEVGDTRPRLGDVAVTASLMTVAAVGMWYGRYWAVLGFQAILAILIVLMSLLLFTAQDVLSALVALAIIGAAGTLFWFLVKSLARIQMPDRRPPNF